jgi:hypothetical protein
MKDILAMQMLDVNANDLIACSSNVSCDSHASCISTQSSAVAE